MIPADAKGIKLNDQGVCQLCQDYQPFQPKGKDELDRLIKEYLKDNTNPDYDCVVPISGGRDSSYVLYYSKEVLGLRPVALHNNNDFETRVAQANLDFITQKLGVPLIRIESKSKLGKKIVVEKFKMNLPFGPGLIASQTCEACKYGFESASYNYARKNGIKIIMWGDSSYESTQPYYDLNEEQQKTPSKWRRLLTRGALSLFLYRYYFKQLKNEYGSDSPDNLHEIHLYDFIDWDQDTIINTITEKMGWKAPDESPTTWRVDCCLVPLVDYLTRKEYGVSKIELGFSTMIRNGKMNRDDAIQKIQQIQSCTSDDQIKKILSGNLSLPESAYKQLF